MYSLNHHRENAMVVYVADDLPRKVLHRVIVPGTGRPSRGAQPRARRFQGRGESDSSPLAAAELRWCWLLNRPGGCMYLLSSRL